MSIRDSTVKVDHVFDDGAGHREVGEFSQQHALVFEDKRHRQIDLEPTSTDQLEEAKGLATAGAQSSKKDTGVNDDLRLLHDGIIYNTTMTSNYVVDGRTYRVRGAALYAASLSKRLLGAPAVCATPIANNSRSTTPYFSNTGTTVRVYVTSNVKPWLGFSA
jgi:hypothetical protein